MSSKQKPPNPSNTHHFVTQVQLGRFSGDESKKFVFTFDKQTNRSYPESIANSAGARNHFNTANPKDQNTNFEKRFCKC